MLTRSVAAGDYEGELLVASFNVDGEALLVRPRAIVFATGAHDGVLAVPGNDLPGVLSARALCRLAYAGVVPDGPAAVVGDGFWADEVARTLGDAAVVRVAAGDLIDVRGTGGVRAVTVREGGRDVTRDVAVVALALPGAPAFELPRRPERRRASIRRSATSWSPTIKAAPRPPCGPRASVRASPSIRRRSEPRESGWAPPWRRRSPSAARQTSRQGY